MFSRLRSSCAARPRLIVTRCAAHLACEKARRRPEANIDSDRTNPILRRNEAEANFSSGSPGVWSRAK